MTAGLPLRGRAFLLTREEERDGLRARLERAGAVVRQVPLTRTLPPRDPAALRAAAARLSDFRWVALTSARAVEMLSMALVEVRGLVAESDTAGPRWACVGPATAERLRARLGVEADVVPPERHAAALAEAMLARDGSGPVLFPAAENARPELPERLRAAGVRVEQVTAYRTVPAAPAEEQLIPPDGFARWDAVVLTSATAVNVLFRTLEARRGPEPARCWLRENGPAALGRTAEGALEALRVAPTVRAPQPSVQDLAAALLDAFGRGK